MKKIQKKLSGFTLVNGISITQNKKFSTELAKGMIASEDGLQDLIVVDLYSKDEMINKKNFHPRFLRFWNEKPTSALDFFRTPPRFNDKKIMLIHGFDVLANADTSNTIQNNLLKPLEEVEHMHLVIADCVRTNIILPTILSRATILKTGFFTKAPINENYSISEKNGLSFQKNLNDKTLLFLAQEWEKLANGNFQEKILAAGILSAENNIGKDNEVQSSWFEKTTNINFYEILGIPQDARQEETKKAKKDIAEKLYYAILELLVRKSDQTNLILELTEWKKISSSSNIKPELNLTSVLCSRT